MNMLKGKAIQSMSRRGNCYDNAVIESFFAILKSECFYSRSYHLLLNYRQRLKNIWCITIKNELNSI